MATAREMILAEAERRRGTKYDFCSEDIFNPEVEKLMSNNAQQFYHWTDSGGVTTIVTDEKLADALRKQDAGGPVVEWQTLSADWNHGRNERWIYVAKIREEGGEKSE